MGHNHSFHTVRDQLSARQAVLHSNMPHRDSVADPDRRNLNRRSACHTDSSLNRFRHLIQMHMSGNNFTFRRNHTDQRPIQFFLRISHGVKQTPHRCFFHALSHLRTSQCHNTLLYTDGTDAQHPSHLIPFICFLPILSTPRKTHSPTGGA